MTTLTDEELDFYANEDWEGGLVQIEAQSQDHVSSMARELINARKKLRCAEEALGELVDDIDTPFRLGLGEPPNPEWRSLTKAREALAAMKAVEG